MRLGALKKGALFGVWNYLWPKVSEQQPVCLGGVVVDG